MGIKYVCGRCGYVIYEFSKIGSSLGLLSPETVSKIYKVCPQCGKPLEPPSVHDWKNRIVVKLKLRR